MASTLTSVQFMDPPGGPGVLGAIKAGPGITIGADGTISTTSGGGIVQTITGTNGVTTAGTTNVLVSLNPPTSTTIGGVRTVENSGIAIDSQGVIRSVVEYTIFPGAGISVTNVSPISSTVAVRPAGTTAPTLGGTWYASDGSGGLQVAPSGNVSLTPATTNTIGGIKVGTGLVISPDGTLATGGAVGTITAVVAGTGLTGGGTFGSVTLNVDTATIFTSPALTGTPTAPTAVAGTSTTQIATTAFVQGATNSLLPLAGGTMSGPITFAPGQDYPVPTATTISPGIVQPDGTTVTIDSNGIISAVGGGGGGGTVTSVTGTAPVQVATGTTTPVISVSAASTAAAGIVQLTSDDNNTSTTLAANAFAVSKVTDQLGILDGLAIKETSFTAANQLLYGTGAGTYNVLPSGTNGQVLQIANGAIAWGNAGGGNLQTVTDAGATTTKAITVGALTTTGAGTIGGALQLSDGTFNYIQFFPDGRGYLEGPIGVGDPPDTLYTLTVDSRPGGSIRTFGATPSIIIDTKGGGTSASLIFRSDGIASATITDTVGGSCTFLTNTADSDLIFGTANIGYLKISGVDGQLTINSGTPNSFSLPTSKGAAGQVLTTDGAGVAYWAANAGAASLPLTGGAMSGTITFAAGQTISGYIANSLLTTTGDIVYASAANTPARLGIGSAGTMLAVNSGLPAWRTSAQLGLLTTTAAASTYAPLNTPTFTGPLTINAALTAGGNGLVLNDGNLVIADTFTPSTSSDTGSQGEIAWDSTYLYVCVAPNTWGRIQIDTTPF